MQYLHDEQHYIDRYDLLTIEECLDYYWAIKNGFAKDRGNFSEYSDEDFAHEVHKCTSYLVNGIKIERFRRKKETIQKWIDQDRQMQELQDNATPPKGISCPECHSSTKVTFTDIENSYKDNARVMFMLACIKCNKHQALYEDGTEWEYKPSLCPTCNSPLSFDSKDVGDISTTTYTCTNCPYTKSDSYNFKAAREKRQKEEERNKKLLTEYRKEFCYDDKTGQEAMSGFDNIVRIVKEWEEKEKKEKNPVYQKAMKLKKITVTQLKELIEKAIEIEGYKELQFDKPEMGQYVIIPFTVQETNSSRKENDTTLTLQKIIKKTLEDTNWRLMSEGISYRLGYVYGRIKGYESEEDFMKLVESKNKNPKGRSVMFDKNGEPIF